MAIAKDREPGIASARESSVIPLGATAGGESVGSIRILLVGQTITGLVENVWPLNHIHCPALKYHRLAIGDAVPFVGTVAFNVALPFARRCPNRGTAGMLGGRTALFAMSVLVLGKRPNWKCWYPNKPMDRFPTRIPPASLEVANLAIILWIRGGTRDAVGRTIVAAGGVRSVAWVRSRWRTARAGGSTFKATFACVAPESAS